MFSSFVQYLGGVFLGWSLGANDSANVFGTAVTSRMVSYRTAVILLSIFVVIGALCQGEAGIRTYSEQLNKNVDTVNLSSEETQIQQQKAAKIAMLVSFAAAITVTLMTILKLPVSTSQAAVGAIIGGGLMQGNVNWYGLQKVVLCWIGTPIGGTILTIVFYKLFKRIIRKIKPSLFVYDPTITILLIICGCYGAYALGANNVANVTGVFVGAKMMTIKQATIFGSIAIVIGAITYSKPVMMTVGKGIIKLDSFTAFICVLSHAVTVHIFAIIGVPVSTSQAIVGAILGIGFIKGVHTINYNVLTKVSCGWLATPFIAGILSCILYFLVNLKYTP